MPDRDAAKRQEYVAPLDVYVKAATSEEARQIIEAVVRAAEEREQGFARFAITGWPEAME